MIDLSYQSRFGGLERLYGDGVLATLSSSHVLVVGLGGVGSWAVEALARSGVGHLTLIDLDDVCATNTNRQLPALDPEWGRLKTEVLADRVRRINPECQVHAVADFLTAQSATRLLQGEPQVVIDAIDSVADKAVLVQEYLEGQEYVVDMVSRDGVHKVVAIWAYDRRPANGAGFVCFGQRLLTMQEDEHLEQLVNYQKKVVDALGIRNGPTHGEVKWFQGEPVLVEVGARLVVVIID